MDLIRDCYLQWRGFIRKNGDKARQEKNVNIAYYLDGKRDAYETVCFTLELAFPELTKLTNEDVDAFERSVEGVLKNG